jgi:hypothetical protein
LEFFHFFVHASTAFPLAALPQGIESGWKVEWKWTEVDRTLTKIASFCLCFVFQGGGFGQK